MANKGIDENGLLYILQRIKANFARLTHTHAASDISSGTLDAARLPAASGTAQGAMSSAHYTKLEGIEAGANAYTHPAYTSKSSGLYKVTVDATGHVSATASVSDSDIPSLPASKIGSGTLDAARIPTATASAIGGIKVGARLTITNGVLSADDQSVGGMTGAGSDSAGSGGSVPGPGSGQTNALLFGDASWDDVWIAWDNAYHRVKFGRGVDTNLAYAVVPMAGASSNGLMSSSDYAKLADFGSASDYALKTDITAMYRHKGSVSAVSNLPSSGNTAGDVYNVTASGMNYVWTGTEWDAIGQIFTQEFMSNSEIDAVFTSAGLTATA